MYTDAALRTRLSIHLNSYPSKLMSNEYKPKYVFIDMVILANQTVVVHSDTEEWVNESHRVKVRSHTTVDCV